MSEFRYPDALMARILDGCHDGTEWWGHHPDMPIQVSNLGNVRSDDGQVLTQGPRGKGGYPGVYVYRVAYFVHHLVLETFVGPRPHGEQCRHWDDDPQNNRLDNLFWGTQLENMADRRRNNRQRKIDQQRHAQAILSRADRPDRHDIARKLAVLDRLEMLAT